MKLVKKYYISVMVASFLIGCGGGTSNSTSPTETGDQVSMDSTLSSNTNSDNTNVNNTNTPSPAIQCKSISLILSKMNIKYSEPSYKDSEDEQDEDGTRENERDEGDSDDNEGSNATGVHNQGRACSQCHSFASGATVFTRLNAPNKTPGAVGYKIQLGNAYVYNAGRGSGNSYLVRYSGGRFTANVIDGNGNIVNSSANLSHDASRLDCNRCHTAIGANGAPGRIVNKRVSSTTVVPVSADTTTCVSFSKNVMPILVAKCKTCHGSNGRFSIGSSNATYANIGALQAPITTAAQYLINKGSNSVNHGGGSVIPSNSNEYITLKAWITEGALNN